MRILWYNSNMTNQNTAPNALIILAVAFLVWFMTQTFKLLVVLVNERRLSLKTYGATGGMPSTHAAVCSAFAMGNGMLFGFTSPHFTMALMFLVAVVHDAVKVRTAIADNTKTMKNFLASIIENEYGKKIMELEELEKTLGDKISFSKINVDTDMETAQKYSIMSIPTFVLEKDGKELDRKLGAIPKKSLGDWLNSYI